MKRYATVSWRLIQMLGWRRALRQFAAFFVPLWLFRSIKSRRGSSCDVKLDWASTSESAREVFQILKENGAFIAFGSLLGLIREGRFLEHDTDIDFIYVGQLEKLEAALARGNSRWVVRRKENYVMKIRIKDVGLSIDVFRGFVDPDKRILATMACGKETALYFFEWSRVFPLTSELFAPGEFLVPAESEYFLSRHYGDGWRRYDPHWSYSAAPSRVPLRRSVELDV